MMNLEFYLWFLHKVTTFFHKIQNRKQGEFWGETGETPGESVEVLGETGGNSMANIRKHLGNWGNIKLRKSL